MQVQGWADPSSSVKAGTLFCPHRSAGHPNTWGCTNARPDLVPQPWERKPARKQSCIAWKCKGAGRQTRKMTKLLGLSRVFLVSFGTLRAFP